MTDVVLFHHACGLTPGVRAFAERVEAAGHRVTLPDLFEGRTLATIPEGIGYAREVGFGAILERGGAAAASLPADVVYAGFSLGVMPAQMLAQTRPGALGAVLMESCVPASEFGEAWPDAVPVQVHGMADDPFFAGEGDLDAARELVAAVPDGEVFGLPRRPAPLRGRQPRLLRRGRHHPAARTGRGPARPGRRPGVLSMRREERGGRTCCAPHDLLG